MSSRLSIAVMRACTQRLPWRTQYLRPTCAGSVSSQASVAVKRCEATTVCGVRDPVAARHVELAVEHDAGRLARLGAVDRRRRPAAPRRPWRVWPLGKSCTASPARTRPWAMRPHSVRGWLPVPSPSRARRTAPARAGRRPCAPARSGRLSSSCSSDGPSYHGGIERLGDVVAAQRRHRHDAGDRDAGVFGEAEQRVAHRGVRLRRVGHRVELVDREHDARHAQQLRQQRVAARLRQQRHAAASQVSSLVMSTSTTAASLPAAAVTMLRVYCSWPGASAMMNLRAVVAK